MTVSAREWIRGVPAPLPAGERVRWQGAPDERALARDVFHVRKIVVYTVALIACRAAMAVSADVPIAFFAAGAVPLVLMGLVAVAWSLGMARLTARTSVYAITDRRVVLRTGIVLTSTINIPFRQIVGVALKPGRDGTGDVALRLGGPDRLAYVLLWPHARPRHWAQPQPAFRCVPEAAALGALLCQGLTDAEAPRTPVRTEAPLPVEVPA
jgi:hypothetical protein